MNKISNNVHFFMLDERRAESNDEEIELAVRSAWLSHVGRYSQGEIANRLGISRIKVNRLIAAARHQGLIKVSIEHSVAGLAELEDALSTRFGLSVCRIVPEIGLDDGDNSQQLLSALALAGSRILQHKLASGEGLTIGLGWGRTLAAVADQMAATRVANHRFVSLLGSLTRHSAANPFDVIHRMVSKTGSEGYYLPVPFIADTRADKKVLSGQKSVRDILSLARTAEFCLVGIGECSEQSFLCTSDLINQDELASLRAARAVGDLVGKFFDENGIQVDSEVNDRSIGIELAELGNLNTVAIAGGLDKLDAIRAALRSNLLHGIITDETVARGLLQEPPATENVGH